MRGFNFVPIRSHAYFPEWKSAITGPLGGTACKHHWNLSSEDEIGFIFYLIPNCVLSLSFLACTQLLVSKPNEDNFAVYISLLDKALNKEVNIVYCEETRAVNANYHSLYSTLNFDWLIYLQITACK